MSLFENLDPTVLYESGRVELPLDCGTMTWFEKIVLYVKGMMLGITGLHHKLMDRIYGQQSLGALSCKVVDADRNKKLISAQSELPLELREAMKKATNLDGSIEEANTILRNYARRSQIIDMRLAQRNP